MLSSIFGSETSSAVQYVVAFAIIFVLLSGLALVLRWLTGARAPSTASVPEGNRNRQPRLGIIDIYELDRQRRLILLRRDNAEHLLLIGGPNDVVVETNIGRVQGARTGAGAGEGEPERTEPGAERHAEPFPPARPVIEAARPSLAQAPPTAPEPVHETPAPVEAPVPAAAPVRVEPAAPGAEPLRRPQRSPLPARGGGIGGRANEVAKASEAARPPQPVAEASRPRIEPSTRVGRPADPAALSDMARQLEEALRRPRPTEADSDAALALTALPDPLPPPPMRSPEAPTPEHAGSPPVAALPQAAPPAPVTGAAQQAPAPREPEPRPVPSEPVSAAQPPAGASAPPPAPSPAPPAPAAPSAPTAAAAQTAPAAAAQPPASPSDAVRDPFSVEEIEAEFARLLGRPFEKVERS